MKEIVIATSNPGKLEEFKEMLKDMEVELHYLAEWPGIEAPEENGRTFAANARLKATYYAKATGMTCIADDSGLEVQALDGEPDLLLDERESQILLELGEVLGRYDVEGQSGALRNSVLELGRCLAGAEEEQRRLGRVYTTLGLGSGAMLVILLL